MSAEANLLTCDCPGCPASYEVEVAAGTSAKESAVIARHHAEDDGWFVEQWPGKPARDICPAHADAYRTMLHHALDGTSDVERAKRAAWERRNMAWVVATRAETARAGRERGASHCAVCGEVGHNATGHR